MAGDGGKGSSPRLKRDDAAYASNWDKIFGKKEKQVELRTGNETAGQTERRGDLPAGSDQRSPETDRRPQ